ncbi:hypothetical protein Pst134EB_024015 [Puccinia striiformis f. sp. tritici]|nr:hypothetical protein Pst134EB_024015 [Puccinia striiformis f. sp. tritici]
MSKSLRLIALVLLTASWLVAVNGEDWKYFGCRRNRDALCAIDPGENSDQRDLGWAHRVEKGKRDYWCYSTYDTYCCPQNQFKAISETPTGRIVRPLSDLSNCKKDGD